MSNIRYLAVTVEATRQQWRDDALCRQVDPELFHPEKGDSVRPAKRVCAACPVREACLREALQMHPVSGMWGGLTERERKRLVVAMRRDARTAAAA